MEQTIVNEIGTDNVQDGEYPNDEVYGECITECGDEDRVGVEFDEETGFVKNITIESDDGSMGDVQAGIEFVYHMREHIIDISVATVYLLVVYAIVLWLKKVFS